MRWLAVVFAATLGALIVVGVPTAYVVERWDREPEMSCEFSERVVCARSTGDGVDFYFLLDQEIHRLGVEGGRTVLERFPAQQR